MIQILTVSLLFIPTLWLMVVELPQTFYGTPIFVDKGLRCISLSCDKTFLADIESRKPWRRQNQIMKLYASFSGKFFNVMFITK